VFRNRDLVNTRAGNALSCQWLPLYWFSCISIRIDLVEGSLINVIVLKIVCIVVGSATSDLKGF